MAGLSAHLEGLDRKCHAIRLSFVRPGFVRTAVTAGLKPPFPGNVERVASEVVRTIDRRSGVLHAPRVGALVMPAIRWLPRFVMRRISFWRSAYMVPQ